MESDESSLRSREPSAELRRIHDPVIAGGVPIIDSGSTYHITRDSTKRFDMKECRMYAVELADGELITGERMGKMKLDDVNKIVLDNVVYAPGFNQTLISVKQQSTRGCLEVCTR